ncbi:MAG: rRNA maturation RNase YbeY [Sphingobacteriaceae bacterium]
MPLPIYFFEEDIVFNLKKKTILRNWIKQTIEDENFKLKELNFIFSSDAYLLSINKQYLDHHTFTDVITFDNAEVKGVIVSDIFISIARVTENAIKYKVDFSDELHRVMVHGILHLLGYTDKKESDKRLMTIKENLYLSKMS